MTEQTKPRAPSRVVDWIEGEPLRALLIATVVATFVYFFGFLPLFINGQLSTAVWAWQAWTPETNYEHAKLIPLIVAFLIWYDRDKLKAAPIGSSRWGWLFIGIGLFLFFVAARTVQARLALTALPFLLFGMVLYVWGKGVARVLLFPIGFLLFMVPLNFLSQATFRLQFIETTIASGVCNFIGIKVHTIGTLVDSADNAFHFQVDEGCSGIRSLMAIAMFSAIYGHFTLDKFWKKFVLFAGSLLFAIIGNAGRLISVFIVGRFFGQDLAGGPYHAVSGFISFTCAFMAMVLFAMLLNVKVPSIKQPAAIKEAGSYDN
ncbi:MAG TPA: exosortase/archaeosortase family protein [Chthoniobacterales bacterium]|jgi:exosortase|nr:exosortase/archaeosortase family protein [Chthoniobacterales bacterium]